MPEFDDDRALRAAFTRFDEDVRASAPAQNFTRVRTIARRRRAVRATAIVALAALVLLLPVAAFAVVGPHPHRNPITRITPSPSTPPVTPPTTPPTATPPAGLGVSSTDLVASGVTLPPWTPSRAERCVRKVTGYTVSGPGSLGMQVYMTAQVDLDHDGRNELVGWFMCFSTFGPPSTPGSGGDSQVVAFTRDATGKIVVFGQVVNTFDGPIKEITRIEPAGNAVRVQVGDWFCCESPGVSQRQWRTYRWTGTRFEQSDGPRTFPPNPKLPHTADLIVRADDLVFGPPADGQRTGTLAVTVTNHGPDAVDEVTLTIPIKSFAVRDPAGQPRPGPWSAHCQLDSGSAPTSGTDTEVMTCTFGRLPGNATTTYKLAFTAPGSTAPSGDEMPIDVNGTASVPVVDPDVTNNRSSFHIVVR
jgi:hypothetical protein